MQLVSRETMPSSPEPYEVPPSQKWDGNDGSWSTFKITIGTPPQELRVLASTQSGETFSVMPEGCQAGDPSDCASSRGAQIFDSAQSPGFQTNVSTTWDLIGQYDIDLEDSLNYTAPGLFGYDKVGLGPAGGDGVISLERQVVGGVAELSYYLGHLPLAATKSKFGSQSQAVEPLIHQLRNTSRIPSMSFAYTAGAKYRLKSVVGQLILGGYDSTRYETNTNDFSFSFSTDPSRLLTVGVESIIASDTLKGTQSLSSNAHFSLIDSTVPHLWLPRNICDAFEASFGLTYDPHTDLYLINSTMRDQLKARSPSVTIKLIDSPEGAATNYTNIVLPYSAFDLQASYPYYTNATNYFPIRRATNESQYTLGRMLLQEAYLIVDYERANFTVAQATFSNPLPPANIVTILPPDSSTDPSLPPTDPSSSARSGLSTGAKVGIAVGCVAFALFVAGLAFFFYRRRRRRRRRHAADNMGIHRNTSELGGIPVSELSLSTMSPHKLGGAPELGGTPRAELEGHKYDKRCVSVNEIPQELETPELEAEAQLRFEEVRADECNSRQSEGRDMVSGSRGVSTIEGHADSNEERESVVSPLKGRSEELVVSPLNGKFQGRESMVSPLSGKFQEAL